MHDTGSALLQSMAEYLCGGASDSCKLYLLRQGSDDVPVHRFWQGEEDLNVFLISAFLYR